MPTIEKSDFFGLTVKRGPGFGYSESYWGDNPVEKDLPDNGARINFGRPYEVGKDIKLSIHFGYTSQSSKNYSRSIELDLSQIGEIVEYLNECLTSGKS